MRLSAILIVLIVLGIGLYEIFIPPNYSEPTKEPKTIEVVKNKAPSAVTQRAGQETLGSIEPASIPKENNVHSSEALDPLDKTEIEVKGINLEEAEVITAPPSLYASSYSLLKWSEIPKYDEFLAKDFTLPAAVLMTEYAKSFSDPLSELGWEVEFVRCSEDECEFDARKNKEVNSGDFQISLNKVSKGKINWCMVIETERCPGADYLTEGFYTMYIFEYVDSKTKDTLVKYIRRYRILKE